MELSVNELQVLKTELFGQARNNNGKVEVIFTGILNQPISFKAKFWINAHLVSQIEKFDKTLREKVVEIAKSIEGVEISKNFQGEEYVNLEGSSEEAKTAYVNKIEEFSKSEKVEIVFEIPLDYIADLNTSETYNTFFKFVKA